MSQWRDTGRRDRCPDATSNWAYVKDALALVFLMAWVWLLFGVAIPAVMYVGGQ